MSNNIPNPFNAPLDGQPRLAVVTTEWNEKITGALAQSCVETLKARGVDPSDIETFTVPGAVELTFAASQLIETGQFDAVIVFGCVIRGGTPHFDYVCMSVTQGITALNADCDTPVIFGVLTVDNEQQALDRLSKGPECADTALKMIQFAQQVKDM